MALYQYLYYTFHDSPRLNYVKVLYNILIEFVTSIKLIWITEMFLNETYRKILISKKLTNFPFRMVSNIETLYRP
jgi:hypothetical protein